MSVDPVSIGVKVALTAASMALTASQRFEGPRLKNLEVSTAAYGTPYPEVDGYCRIDGCIYAFAEQLKEKKVTSKTKGGKYAEWKYFLTGFVVAAGHQVDGIVKIRMNNHLVYDTTKPGPISPLIGFFMGSRGSPVKLVKGKNLRIYLGTEDQPVDPRYAAWCEDRFGPDSATARRGTAGIFLEEIPLEKLGNAPPQVGMDVVNNPETAYLFADFTPGGAIGPVFSHDRMRALFHNTSDTDYAIWDVPTQSKLIDSFMLTEIEELAFNENGKLWVVCGTLGDTLKSVSPDGNSIEKTIDVGNHGDRLHGLGNFAYMRVHSGFGPGAIKCDADQCALVDFDFVPEMFFKDGENDHWAIGMDGTDIRLYNISELADYTIASPGGVAGFASAFANGDGDLFVIIQTTAVLIDRVSMTVADSASIGGGASEHFDVMRRMMPGSPSFFTAAKEIDAQTLETVRTYDLTDWTADNLDLLAYEPITHSLWCDGTSGVTIRYLDRVAGLPTTLGSIVAAKCERRGIPDDAIDASELTQPVIGYWTIQGSGADQVAPLLDIHDVDLRRHDFLLSFKVRGAASAEVIGSGDFVTEEGARFDLSLVPDDRLPARVEFNYADHTNDQQPNTASDTMALSAIASQHKQVFDLTTYADEPDSAQPKVERFLRRKWFEREIGEARVSARWSKLEPGDVKTIEIDGDQRVVRLTEVNRSGFTLALKWVRDDPRVHDESASAGPTLDGYDPEEIYITAPTKAQLFDIPFLSDAEADDKPLLHFAASFYGSGSWPGAIIWQGEFGVGEYEQWNAVDSADKAVWGYAEDVLGDVASPWLWDRGNSIVVQLKSGSLTSATEAEINADATINQFLFGSPGRWEIGNFTTATHLGSSRYQLSGFKRGRRGTEWAIAGHAVNDEFWLAEDVKRDSVGLSEIGLTDHYKGQTVGRDPVGAAELEITLEGQSLKPYAPANLAAVRDPATGNWFISGVRRTRIGGAWVGGTPIPLSEASEDYDIVVLDSEGEEVRELSAVFDGDGAFSATYSATNQVSDFGSAQSAIRLAAYQLSDAVGRGFPALIDAVADSDLLPAVISAGVVAYADNAAVTPVNPGHQSSDTLLCIAFVRNNGSGRTLACATTGWSAADGITNPVLMNGSRMWLFQNECDTDSELNPVITPSGGSAGDTVVAVVLRIPLRDLAANFGIGSVSSNASNNIDIAFAQNSPSINDGNAVIAIGIKDNDTITGADLQPITAITAGLDWTQLVAFQSNVGNDTAFSVDYAVNDSGGAYLAGTAGKVTGGWSVAAPSAAVYLEVPLL